MAKSFLRKTPGRDIFTREFDQTLIGHITPMWFKLFWYIIKKESKESSIIMVTNPYKNSTEKPVFHRNTIKTLNISNDKIILSINIRQMLTF